MKKSLLFAILLGIVLVVGCDAPSSASFRRLNAQQGVYAEPKWSSNGEEILVQFAPMNTAQNSFSIVQVKSGKQHELPITSDLIAPKASLGWWLDDTIGFVNTDVRLEGNPLFQSQLLVADPATGKIDVLLSDLPTAKASWNPTARQVALILKESEQQYGLYLYDVKTEELSPLYSPRENQRVEDLAFERNGERIGYTIVVSHPDTNDRKTSSLEVMELATRTRKKIFDAAPGSIESPTWSPDGTWIAARLLDPNFGSSIILIKADGTETRLVEQSANIVPVDLDWAPNSNLLSVTSLGRPGQNDLYLIDLTTTLKE